jgi:hypothetical protein
MSDLRLVWSFLAYRAVMNEEEAEQVASPNGSLASLFIPFTVSFAPVGALLRSLLISDIP